MLEKIQFVNADDLPIGSGPREEAWQKGFYFRLVHIILKNELDQILLQKRSMQKKLWPGKWTNAATGHVDEGETYVQAATRELSEEIGIELQLEYKGRFLIQQQERGKTINQFNGVFFGTLPKSTPLTVNPSEVSEVQWFTTAEIAATLYENPNTFTPAAQEIIRRFIL